MSYLPDHITIEHGPDRPLTRAERALDTRIDAERIIAPARAQIDRAYGAMDDAHAEAIAAGDTIQAASIAAVMRQAAALMEGVAS